MERELCRIAILAPCARHRVPNRIDRAVVGAVDRGQLEMYLRIAFGRLRRVKSVDALIDAVHRCDEPPLRVMRNVQLQSIAHAVRFDRALPRALRRRHRTSRTLRKRNAGLPMKYERQVCPTLGPNAIDSLAI